MEYKAGAVFDEWLKITDRNLEGEALGVTRRLQRRTRLFCFEDDPTKDCTLEEMHEKINALDDARLPFPVTTFEIGSEIAVTLTDSERESGGWIGQALMKAPGSIESAVLGFYFDWFVCDGYSGISPISMSWFERLEFVGKLEDSERLKQEYRELLLSVSQDIMSSLLMLNDQNKFVLETTPLHTKKRGKTNKARRSDDRPVYTVITPGQIRKQMKLKPPSEPGGVKRRGGDVRGHWRIYKHERYSEEVKAKPQWQPAKWRGPKENTVGNKRYKVRLDL